MNTNQRGELNMLKPENIPGVFGGYGSGEGWAGRFFNAYSLHGSPSDASFNVSYVYVHDEETHEVTGMTDISLSFTDDSFDKVSAHMVGEDELFYGLDSLEPLLTVLTFIASSDKLPENLAEDIRYLLDGDDEVTWYTHDLIEKLKSTRVLKELRDYPKRSIQLISVYTLGEYSFAVYPRYPVPYVGRTNLIAVFRTGEEEKIVDLFAGVMTKCLTDLGLDKGFVQDEPTENLPSNNRTTFGDDKAPKPKRPVETLGGISVRNKNTQ